MSYSGRAAIGEGRTASYMGRSPIVSRFSSRGPDFIDVNRNPTDVLKPDILAPGHQIWAAWSPMSVQDPILSGTPSVPKMTCIIFTQIKKKSKQGKENKKIPILPTMSSMQVQYDSFIFLEVMDYNQVLPRVK